MRKAILSALCAGMLAGVAITLFGQSETAASSKWQPATVLEVKKHHGPLPANIAAKSSAEYFDIRIRAKSSGEEYLLLYTPPPGRYGFQFLTPGRDALVLIEKTTVTVNDVMGRPVKVPIVSQNSPAKNP
jgi:hypothetical protein